jgi:hypothetical protein
MAVIDGLAERPGVSHAGLLGDLVHVITEPGAYTLASLGAVVAAISGRPGPADVAVEPADVTLEDVFTVLTGGAAAAAREEAEA